jgi:signal transduction histidine kinase
MNLFSSQYKRWSKWLLLISALCIGTATLWYTNSLVKELRIEERTKVNIWAKATEQTTKIDDLDEDVSFIFEVINHNTTIPVMLIDDQGNINYYKNLNPHKVKDSDYLQRQLELMKQSHKPIVFEYADGKKNSIYYRDSILLTRLQYFPFVILLVVALFVLIAYLAFNSTRNAEQNKVWAGMARETAHQIGTPLSSMMGWVALLQQKEGNEDVAIEMNKDILRLQTIAERFSKIGSQPVLEILDLNKIVSRSVNYIKDRSSSKIDYSVELPSEPIMVALNPQLFEWVVENLLRNAIDALTGAGAIKVVVASQGQKVSLDVIDTGKGLRSSQMKQVFDPGYTTKKRGWGLGLSLVKRIVKDYHQGQVFVQRSELGKGSTFRITLTKA